MKKILVDTSVWVDHFRHHNGALENLLTHGRVMAHPLILGEIACGTLHNRRQTLSHLKDLGQVRQASIHELMDFIEREHLFGLGCGLVDLLLLASTLITQGVELWTLDKRLSALAERFGVMYRPILH